MKPLGGERVTSSACRLAAVLLLLLGTASVASADPADLTITLPGGDQGDDRTPLLEGAGDPAYPVHILVNGAEVAGGVPAVVDGAWSFQLLDPLAQGEQAQITAQVRDGSDQVIAEQSVYYFVFPPLAAIEITEPATGDTVNGRFDLRANAQDGGTLQALPRRRSHRGEYRVRGRGQAPGLRHR